MFLMKVRYRFLIVGVLISSNLLRSQVDSSKKASPFTANVSYVGDVVGNFSGGIKQGATYLGLLNVKTGFNTEAANWWKSGSLFANIGNTHGGQPSTNFVGDFQGVSNIEAGSLTFLYELWYKQSFGKVDITVGLQDLNANFATSEYAGLFTNSSFGIHSSIADNVSSPIFPLTALGVNVFWKISDTFLWGNAIFDGTPDDFEVNPYNINWKLNKNKGFLAVSEFQIKKSLISGKSGCYKFGAYFHEHNDTIDIEQKNRGFYFVGDQQLSDKWAVFSQIGLSPKSLNKHNHYYSLGVNCKGLLDARPNDGCGVAIAYAGIDHNTVGSETTLELTYQLELNKHIYFRPDVQYVINPAGTDTKLNNAIVGFLRVGMKF